MYYFNEKKYDFWDIYTCIHKFYPIGIPEGMVSFYNSYPGIVERRKIIAKSIYDNNIFKQKCSDFYEDISKTTGQEVIGTTTGITSCYSALMEIKSTVMFDLKRTKELHFFVSLLGPFYTIVGIDQNEITINNKFHRSTNFLIVSPENEFKDWFIYIGKRIEEQFKKYRFVPFFICKKIIDGLSLEYKENNCAVFHALFNYSVDIDSNIMGDENYKSWQWLVKGDGISDK